jgi:hypothetical protein
MKKAYLVLSQISHDGKTFLPPGSNPDDDEDGIIYLTDEEAQRLKACDAIEEIDDGQLILEPATPSEPLTPADTLNPPGYFPLGFSNGESTASADALAEQTDKETNQDPLNNKDGGDATPTADLSAAGETLTPGASAPGAEEAITPASADAVQDPVDPAPAVVSTAGGDGQTILDPAATPLDGAATGEKASPVVAQDPAPSESASDPVAAVEAPAAAAPADEAKADAPKKTRKAAAAK